jgi:hypothetical protein
MSETLIVNHNAGFFSCYTIRLSNILAYFNKNQKCPRLVDSSKQFIFYKMPSDTATDYTPKYINPNPTLTIAYQGAVKITNDPREEQFSNYKNLNFSSIAPFIQKYFQPSDPILTLVAQLERNYGLHDYLNLAVCYYRGTDKCLETNLCDFKTFIAQAVRIRHDNAGLNFLLVSDEPKLIKLFLHTFPGTIIFDELLNNMGRSFLHSQIMLASVLIAAKCKHLICSSGNVALWMTIFRGHGTNLYQYLSPKKRKSILSAMVHKSNCSL